MPQLGWFGLDDYHQQNFFLNKLPSTERNNKPWFIQMDSVYWQNSPDFFYYCCYFQIIIAGGENTGQTISLTRLILIFGGSVHVSAQTRTRCLLRDVGVKESFSNTNKWNVQTSDSNIKQPDVELEIYLVFVLTQLSIYILTASEG